MVFYLVTYNIGRYSKCLGQIIQFFLIEDFTPQTLFQTSVYGPGLIRLRNHYAVTKDGQRFLINALPDSPTLSPITVVLNWTAGLTR